MKILNVGAISTAASLGVSYLANNATQKKDQQVLEVVKEFQEQNITQINEKLNLLIEENNRLKEAMLTENDVKMIVSKAMDKQNTDADDVTRRGSTSGSQPISLQIKGGRGRFNRGFNGASKNSNKDSTDSDNRKDATLELCEQMNKFLKVSQEYNGEMMREMKSVNQNMAA
jgi:hypothetical protein